MAIESLVRPGIDHIQAYVPGLTDDELRGRFGLASVVKLNANENALGPSPLAKQAAVAETTDIHHYPDGSSQLLRAAIAVHHGVTEQEVAVGNGSDNVIKMIAETFLNPGDNIVVPFPTFSEYELAAQVMGAAVKKVSMRADFTYDAERLVAAVDDKTKLLFICTPNNPTSTVMTARELDWVIDHTPDTVLIVIDLAYNDYSTRPDRADFTKNWLATSRVITLHTFSKLYGLAGLRVGYGLANPEVWSYVNRIREPFNVNRLAQRAAAAALADVSHRDASIQLAKDGKAAYRSFSDRLGLFMPDGEGNFTLISVGDGRRVMQAMMEKGVMVRHGFPGVLDCIRITYGLAHENERCLQTLEEVLRAI